MFTIRNRVVDVCVFCSNKSNINGVGEINDSGHGGYKSGGRRVVHKRRRRRRVSKGCRHGCCGGGHYQKGGCRCCSSFEEATAYKQTQN